MTSEKYVIKNCEQIHSSDNFCLSRNIFCQDCTDCLLKRIVKQAGYCLCLEILELLDIEEVE